MAHARLLHPDAGGVDDAGMREVNEAWHVLRDPTRRLAHDRDLGIDHGPRYAYAPWEPPPPAGDRSVPLADQVDDRGVAPSRLGDLLVLVPAGFLAAAVACFAVAALMLNGTLLAIAIAALLLSGVTFAVMPFLKLASDRRRSRR